MTRHADVDVTPDPKQQADHVAVAPLAGGGHDALKSKPFAGTAMAQIDHVLGGSGSIDTLPELFSVLPENERKTFREHRMSALLALPGDLALQLSQLLHAEPAQAIKTALSAKPPADQNALRAYLAELSGKQLASITGDAFTKLKKALPGPLLDSLPRLPENLYELEQHTGFVRWLIETTDPAVCASVIAQYGSEALGKTIDSAKLWDPWVDQLRAPLPPEKIHALAQAASNAAVKSKLQTLAGPAGAMTDDERTKYRQQHAKDIETELAGKPSVKSLLEAAGRAGTVDPKVAPKLLEELQRLHASADDILALTQTLYLDGTVAFTALLAAPGVSAQHIATFLGHGILDFKILTDDKLRAGIRKTAPQLRLFDVIPSAARDYYHSALADLKNEGLRKWFFDEASPHELLWFAASEPKLAARTTRQVIFNAGLDWVHKLTSAEDEKLLRVLAMNISDGRTEKFVRDVLLGDPPPDKDAPTKPIKGAKPVDDRVFGGEEKRLDDAFNNAIEDELLARLGDIEDKRRAELGKDIGTVLTIASRVRNDQWARAAYLLHLGFAWTVKASPGRAVATVAYLHSRPKAEELATLDEAELVKKAASRVHTNLLAVFPSLAEPKRLAKTLKAEPDLLELLLAGSDPNLIANLISRDEAAPVASEILENKPALLERLPRFKDMTARGKEGVDRLSKSADDAGALSASLEDMKDGTSTVDMDAKRQGHRLAEVEQKKTLVEKIEELAGLRTKRVDKLKQDDSKHHHTDKEQAEENRESSVNALALLDMHRSEVPDLLTDRLKRSTVDHLHAMIDLPPDVAVPWLAPAQLVRMPNALRWWLSFRDPMPILHVLIANPVGRALVTGGLDTNTNGARQWLERVPRGPALDESEARLLDQIRPDLKDPDALRALFLTRFGFPAPADFTTDGVTQLYSTLCRLPKGHVTQERIRGVTHHDLGDEHTAGRWGPGTKEIEIAEQVTAESKATDTFYAANTQGWLPKDAFKKQYGFDDARFSQLMHEDRIEFRLHVDSSHGDFEYRLKEQNVKLFTQVVLHEVGHAVDEILGKRTQPVFGYGGWKEYDLDGGFEAWATELGGWDSVDAADRKKIKEAFKDAVRAETSVKDLVPADHPALDAKYAKVGLVAQLRAGKTFSNSERIKIGSRVFSANPYYEQLFSLDANAAAVAPSDYSLYAPAEYFAESYVEYYRGVDGSPGSSAKKGGALASPVKSWFDQNVDRVRFNPQRFDSGYDAKVDADEKKPA